MNVYRLCRAAHSRDLSGRGAELSGGRWNSKGVPMIYTSESRALCTAEVAVHLPLGSIPSDYVMVTLAIPDSVRIHELKMPELAPGWKSFPHSMATRELGDAFIKHKRHLVMKVPSAVVEGDFNYLVNPLHKDLKKVKILRTEAFGFDPRLFER